MHNEALSYLLDSSKAVGHGDGSLSHAFALFRDNDPVSQSSKGGL